MLLVFFFLYLAAEKTNHTLVYMKMDVVNYSLDTTVNNLPVCDLCLCTRVRPYHLKKALLCLKMKMIVGTCIVKLQNC